MENNRQIQAIIFDVGVVLCEGRPDFIQCFKENGISLREDLWDNEDCKQLIFKFCTGKYGLYRDSAKDFFAELPSKASINTAHSFEQFKLAWNAAIICLNFELINQLHLLKIQGYRLFILR